MVDLHTPNTLNIFTDIAIEWRKVLCETKSNGILSRRSIYSQKVFISKRGEKLPTSVMSSTQFNIQRAIYEFTNKFTVIDLVFVAEEK